MTVLVRTTFTRKITLKQDLIQQVTIRGNVNQITFMKYRLQLVLTVQPWLGCTKASDNNVVSRCFLVNGEFRSPTLVVVVCRLPRVPTRR